MAKKKWTDQQIAKTNTYLTFLAKRARGQVQTGARFQRDFVTSHPEYKKDSIVSPRIAYDLACVIDALEDESHPDYATLRQSLLGQILL
jgi:glutamate--cysteine ligase catalytic subunit